jgi:hypothetical protein
MSGFVRRIWARGGRKLFLLTNSSNPPQTEPRSPLETSGILPVLLVLLVQNPEILNPALIARPTQDRQPIGFQE